MKNPFFWKNALGTVAVVTASATGGFYVNEYDIIGQAKGMIWDQPTGVVTVEELPYSGSDALPVDLSGARSSD